jgi:hypothetical protein
VKAHRSDDKGRMKEIATILSHFKGYPQCIDAFIEQSQMVRRFSGLNFLLCHVVPPMHGTHSVYLIILDLIIQIIVIVTKFKAFYYVALSIFHLDQILFSVLFSQTPSIFVLPLG